MFQGSVGSQTLCLGTWRTKSVTSSATPLLQTPPVSYSPLSVFAMHTGQTFLEKQNQEETYMHCRELVHGIMKAEKPCDLMSTGWTSKKSNVGSPAWVWSLGEHESPCPRQEKTSVSAQVIRQRASAPTFSSLKASNSLDEGKAQKKGHLLYSSYWFEC